MNVLDWLLDSDPSIRWQVLRDLADAPDEVVEVERGRVATTGWGARLLAVRDDDGQWAGGACFPASGWPADSDGQPWTSTLPSLELLRSFGLDPTSEQARETMALVHDNCRWEHAGQPFFSGEVEACINGRTLALAQSMEHTPSPAGPPVVRAIKRLTPPSQSSRFPLSI
jgi:hypothetical protein